MAKFLLGICLMLVVASSVIYEAQGHFMLKDYLEKKVPSKCNEFALFANKGMLELATDLQGSCPPTPEFNTFFTQFKSYVTYLESASAASQNIDAEITTKCDELFKSMAPLCSGKGVKSTDAGAVKATMLSMGKTLIAEKKNTKPVTPEHKKKLATDMSKWTNTFASFVKTASERKGRPLDIAIYGLDGNTNAGGATSGGKTESGSSASTKTESKSASGFTDTTGPTLGSPSESPKASPSGSSSAGCSETSTKGSASAGGKAIGD